MSVILSWPYNLTCQNSYYYHWNDNTLSPQPITTKSKKIIMFFCMIYACHFVCNIVAYWLRDNGGGGNRNNCRSQIMNSQCQLCAAFWPMLQCYWAFCSCYLSFQQLCALLDEVVSRKRWSIDVMFTVRISIFVFFFCLAHSLSLIFIHVISLF